MQVNAEVFLKHAPQGQTRRRFSVQEQKAFMKPEDIIRIKEILDDSRSWEPELLEKMPKLFLLIRENYLRILSEEKEPGKQ